MASPMAKFRSLVALGAFFVTALAVSACGESVPGNAVARIGDDPITRTTFDHWLQIAAISQQGAPQQQGKRPTVKIPQPPDFTACVAGKRASAPKPAKGKPGPTTADFRKQCQSEYEGLRDQVLNFLISAQWISGEATDQDLTVTDKQVRARFDTLKKQSFRKEQDFQNFLISSGMTTDDLLFRVRNNLLSDKLREKVTKGKDKVSDAEIRSYYNKNKQRFAQPERRDLRVILTKTKARADQAKAAVQSGQSFKSVTKRFSIDQTTKNQGGVLLAVARGQQDRALDASVFKAKKGQLVGPVKTAFGYYIFKVQKITPATQQTLLQTKETIKQILSTQNQQKALDTFIKDFREKWKTRTNCRKGFVTQDCKNAPAAKTQPSPPPGAIPQPQPTPTAPARP
jgi:parvulin-like peptidyl-prolyl isomerase